MSHRYSQCDNSCTTDCGHCKGDVPARIIAQVNATTQDVINDYGGDVNPDDVFHDVLVSTLHGVDPWIAAEVWRTQIGGPLPLELQQTPAPEETR